MKIIDTHQHFWKYDSSRHDWIDEDMKYIRKDFLPEDLQPVFVKNGIDGCIAVQADQTEAENEFLLQLSQKYHFIKGITGWVDFRQKNIAERLEYYSDYKLIKGFRHIVQAETDPNFLLQKNFCKGISTLRNFDFIYELLVFPYQLGAVLEFVRRFPNQKFVINHMAKPYIKNGYMDGWKTLIAEIAKSENVYCKLSGLITEADFNTWTYDTLKPYIEIVLKSFGPQRLMYGSDWPVCLVAGAYHEVKEIAQKAVSEFSDSEREAFWAGNAVTFYNI